MTARPRQDWFDEVLNRRNLPPWHTVANCRGRDPDLFFVDNGENCTEAKLICAGCSVRQECLEYALETRQVAGLWGGLSPKQRTALMWRRRRA